MSKLTFYLVKHDIRHFTHAVVQYIRRRHYHCPQTLPDKYKDGSSHPVDDFCPSKQLEYMINKCGQPDIIYETEHDGKTSARDANDTWNKLQQSIEDFVKKFTGEDLKEVVLVKAESLMKKLLQKTMLKTISSKDSHKHKKCEVELSMKS